LEERARKIAEAKAVKRAKEEAECKKCEAAEKAEVEHKQCKAKKREMERRQHKAEKRETERRAREAAEEEETNQRIAEVKRAAEAAWKVKAAKAPPTTKVSPGVLLQVQVQLTSQQCKVQETVEVSDSTEVAPPLVTATLEAPVCTNLEFVEEEESTSGSSVAGAYD
jgi:hypothetical protein